MYYILLKIFLYNNYLKNNDRSAKLSLRVIKISKIIKDRFLDYTYHKSIVHLFVLSNNTNNNSYQYIYFQTEKLHLEKNKIIRNRIYTYFFLNLVRIKH